MNNNLTIFDNTIDKELLELREKYKSIWDDSVHDSFNKLLNQLQNVSTDIHIVRCNLDSIVNEINVLNVQAIVNTAEELCAEAESL